MDEELTFDSADISDSGKYECIVSNRLNAEKSNAVELQVLPSPGKSIMMNGQLLAVWQPFFKKKKNPSKLKELLVNMHINLHVILILN